MPDITFSLIAISIPILSIVTTILLARWSKDHDLIRWIVFLFVPLFIPALLFAALDDFSSNLNDEKVAYFVLTIIVLHNVGLMIYYGVLICWGFVRILGKTSRESIREGSSMSRVQQATQEETKPEGYRPDKRLSPKKFYILLGVFVLVVIVSIISWGKRTGVIPAVFPIQCRQLEQEIDAFIREANYCEVDSDCVESRVVAYGCDCSSLINKNFDIKYVDQKITDWAVSCSNQDLSLLCPACPSSSQVITCQQNKCVGEYEDFRLHSTPPPLRQSSGQDWQTYRNIEFGFEVRYPAEIYKSTPLDSKDTYPELNYERRIPDFREGVRLASSKPEFYCSNFELLTYEKGGKTLNQWMQEYPEFERGFEEKKAGVFAGKPSMSFSYPRGDLVPGLYLVEKDSFIIQINNWGGLSGESPSPKCGSILTTFRFIDDEKRDITVSENWKYFNFPEDYRHHLEIPYPSNWFIGCCGDADSFSIHIVHPFEYKDVPIEDQPYMQIIDFRSWECPDGSFYCSIDETRVISPHQFFDKMKVEIGKTGEFLKIGGLSNLIHTGSAELSAFGTVDVYEGMQSGTVSVKVYLVETGGGVSAIVFRKPDEFGGSLMQEFLRRFKINSKN